MTFGKALLSEWMLDPAVTYLNHGTVGAPPRRVLAAQQAIRDEIERQPSKFLLRDLTGLVGAPPVEPTRMRRAAAAVAASLGARGEDLVFVDNATAGMNAVLRSASFDPGDEILLTDHVYGAVARTAAFVARERRAVVRMVTVPYPPYDPQAVVAAVAAAITPKTRVAVFDHISAESAVILPVVELIRTCRARGVRVLVDGAHVPGALPLDISSLGADWYTANLHKWAHAPRSCGILWARPEHQAALHPLVISWGYGLGFTAEFDWVGTRDPSPWLAAPAGFEFLNDLGFDRQRLANHDLAWQAARMLADRWGTRLGVREADVGAMVTIPLPASLGDSAADAARLRDELLFDDRIEVQVHASHGQLWARISAQVYNAIEDYERLGDAVATRAHRGR
jgi:isopenicillin-N epimerase